ncbi:hypothetical protein FACS1894142_4220 [Spirochaetia bacterium]|nr:hypothetical protein FACS1894142_4220 [Spirochaetia bacterium]
MAALAVWNSSGGRGMNGQTKGLQAVVFDTNVLIKYINKLPGCIDLATRKYRD